MGILQHSIIPEITYYLVAILGLLVIWQYYYMLIQAGRIQAVDFWDVSGIRMMMHFTPWDDQSCPSCREANGTIFLPSLATKRNFSTLKHPCSNPTGCRCVVVGLYGGWPEANRLVQKLRKTSKKKPILLEGREILDLFQGPWHRSIIAATDHLTIQALEGLYLEGMDLEKAIQRYRYVVNEARGARDLRLLVPAYLRLTELLERTNCPGEALEVINRFEKRFLRKKQVFYYPSAAERRLMFERKSRLMARPFPHQLQTTC